jgi:hypothetical protein
MSDPPRPAFRRWVLFAPCVLLSALPALLLTTTFAQPGRFAATFFAFWVELLIGPVKYWLPVFLGQPSEFACHPMTGFTTWLYAVCLPLSLAHPVRPRFWTGVITVVAFIAWYTWGFLTLAAYEY